MPPAFAPATTSRAWWSRSKSSKDSLRPNHSVSTFAEEDDTYPSPNSSISSRPKDPSKFNTLASAIGFKSKKLPALTIQDPPSPLISPRTYPKSRPASGHNSVASPATVDRTPFYTNRPPAKSISTVRSSEYDYDGASEPHSEPRTPSDHPRDRLSYQQSVMTFSEIDPFASGGIVVQHLPQDPNRLSVYSDSSMLDPQQKRPDVPAHAYNRVSYGSSSSNSHGNYSDMQALSPLSASSFGRSPTASRSAYDLTQTQEQAYVDIPSTSTGTRALRTRRTKTPSGSNSSNSTVTQHDYRSRLSEPPGSTHLPRKRSSPHLARSRGMTVGAIDHQPGSPHAPLPVTQPLQVRRTPSASSGSGSSSPSASNTPSPSPVAFSRERTTSTATSIIELPVSPRTKHPKVLVRKPSSSRMNLPPPSAAPPTSGLPLPPLPSSPYGQSPLEFRASSSSSSLNFAPSVDLHDLGSSDPIAQLMNDHYDLGPFEAARPRDSPKGKSRKNRNTYILNGDLSPTRLVDLDTSLPSPLSKFPPVPTMIHGDVHPKAAAKLLKKMSSQQHFAQRHSATSIASSVSVAAEDLSGHSNGHASPPGGKTPRKQRSFHAPRVPIPLPPLPGLRSSTNGHPSSSVETLPQPASPVVEPRRSSITSPRKRLFSGSSARRSTSSHGATSPSEEDKRSIFSFESDIRPTTSSGAEMITMSFGTAGGPLSLVTKNACRSPSSLWDDSNGSPGGVKDKRASQSDYTPQYIMPPVEQLRLAEKLADEDAAASVQELPDQETDQFDRKPKLDLQPGDFGLTYSVLPSSARSRSNSVMSHQSTSTLAFGDRSGMSRGGSVLSSKSSAVSAVPRLASISQRKVVSVGGGPSRTSSLMAKATTRPPPLLARPSTAQASLTPPTSPSFAKTTHSMHSPEMQSASLPPPPRRKLSRHDLQDVEVTASKRASIVPINPLSPPPNRSVRLRRQDSTDTTSTVLSRPPSSFDKQKIMKRRSLMKKPSFLDIEDEVEVGPDSASDDELGGPLDSPSMDGSFLDMEFGKNSFDTVRSVDSAFY